LNRSAAPPRKQTNWSVCYSDLVPELPTTSKGAATRRRILDAAATEFSARGIAGARVDRIIAAARTNKAQLYAYFGSKEGLFDAVVADLLGSAEGDGFDVDGMADWAVALYDANLRRPDLWRLFGWIRLEQRPAGLVLDNLGLEPKLAAIAKAQEAGRIRSGDPADLLTLVVGMACSWSPTSGAYVATADEPGHVHDGRRALIREAVRRAIAP
jgi:AcrR family transcriptional regulator